MKITDNLLYGLIYFKRKNGVITHTNKQGLYVLMEIDNNFNIKEIDDLKKHNWALILENINNKSLWIYKFD